LLSKFAINIQSKSFRSKDSWESGGAAVRRPSFPIVWESCRENPCWFLPAPPPESAPARRLRGRKTFPLQSHSSDSMYRSGAGAKHCLRKKMQLLKGRKQLCPLIRRVWMLSISFNNGTILTFSDSPSHT
jgi:hypothetical protein